MTESAHGVFGRRSSAHCRRSSSWTTTPLGTYGAESRSSRTVSATCCCGQSRTCPYTSGAARNRRPPPARTGPAAASPGSSGRRSTGPSGRAPGSRSAARAAPRARSRARSRASARSAATPGLRVRRPSSSNRHSSTASAPPAHSAKLVPATPSGPDAETGAQRRRALPATRVRRAARRVARRSARWRAARRRATPCRACPVATARCCGHRLLLGCARHLSSLPRLVERSENRRTASRPRCPVASSSPLFCPSRGSHSRFPGAGRVVGSLREARTEARAAREGRAGRRTDMGRTAGRSRRLYFGRGCTGRTRRSGNPGRRRTSIRVAPDDGAKAVRPRQPARGTGARRAPGVGEGRQVAGRAGVAGARADRRGRPVLAARRRAARAGRQVHRRRRRAGRPAATARPGTPPSPRTSPTSGSSATSPRRTAPPSAPE